METEEGMETDLGIRDPLPSDVIVEKRAAARSERPPEIDDDPNEEESSNPVDFSPYIAQLSLTTRQILEDDFHANFIHLIHPRKPKSS